MGKELKKTIFSVIAGVSAVFICYIWFTFLLNFTGAADLEKIALGGEGAVTKSILFIKWSSLALCLLIIPFLIGCGISFFTNLRLVKFITAVLGLAIFASAVTFMIVPAGFAHYSKDSISEVALTAILSFQANLGAAIVPTIFLTAANIAGIFCRSGVGRMEQEAAK